MQKFVIDSGSSSSSSSSSSNDTINAWHRVCQEKQIPFIVVEKRTKYATVRWDYISYSSEKENNINKNQGGYIEELKKSLKGIAIPDQKLALTAAG